MPTSPLLCRSPTAAQLICCDLPHGESSGTSSPPTPPSLSASDELEDTCCFDYVQPCDSPDCEEEVCDDEDCVISLSSPPCAGCGEARMERRSSSSRAEGEHEVQRVQGGGVVGNGQGEVLECSCGFQESSSWECSLEMGGGAFGEFEQYLDCCHPSYTPFPQIPMDPMEASDAFSQPRVATTATDDSTAPSVFGSPSIQSEPGSDRMPEIFSSSDSSGSLPPPALPLTTSSADDLYSNFSVLLDAALSSKTGKSPTQESVGSVQQAAFPLPPTFPSQPPSALDNYLAGSPRQALSSPASGFYTGAQQSPSPLYEQSPLSSIDPSPLNCEWSNCNESFPTLDQLVEHFRSTSSHLPTVPEQPFVFGAPVQDDSALPIQVDQPLESAPTGGAINALTCQWGSDPHLLSGAANMAMQDSQAAQGAGMGAVELSPSEILLQHLLRDHLAGPPQMQSPVSMGPPVMAPPSMSMAGFADQLHLASAGPTSGGLFPQEYRPSPVSSDYSPFAAKQDFSLIPPVFGSSAGSSEDSISLSSSSQHPQPHHHTHHHGHIHPHPYHRPHHDHAHAHPHPHVHHTHHLLPHPHVHTHPHQHHHAHVHHAPKIITASHHRRSNSTASSIGGGGGPTIHACGYTGCTEVFEDTTTLTEHINKVHVGSGKESYTCGWEGCERGVSGPIFKSKQKIMRHIQAHTGHKPFVCPTCNQTFSEAATLAQHQRRHTNEKPFVCDYPGCTKAFTLVASLTIHKRTHDGIKPFACPHCDRAFVEASNLTKHIRTHTGDKPFQCLKCEKRFARPDQLSRHQSVHTRKEAAAAAAAAGEVGVGMEMEVEVEA